MNEVTSVLFSLIAGLFLGAFFFFGLWWTVKKGLGSKNPALWFFFSGVIRTIIVIVGFYYIGNGSFQKMLSCFLGFLIARYLSTLFLRETKRRI